MNIIFAIALILAVLASYMFVIESFSVAFRLTGLTVKMIKFQVASLFTGSGFTTSESEIIVNDDRRRRIAITCMYTGHVYSVIIMGLLVNLIMSVIISINSQTAINVQTFTSWYAIVFYVSLAFFIVVSILKIPAINKKFQSFLERTAINLSRTNKKNNLVTVIDMYGKSTIAEIFLNKVPDFAKDVSLSEMQLTKKYMINILTIRRGSRNIEVSRDTMLAEGDILVVFGLTSDIKEAFVNSVDKKNKTIVVNDSTNTLSLLNNYGQNALMEIEVQEVPKEIDGVKMKDSHLVDRHNINVGIIKRGDEYIPADKDAIIQKGDKITVFGPYQNIKHLFRNDE